MKTMNTQEPQHRKRKLNELHNLTEDYRQIVSDIMQLSISKFSKYVGLFVYLKGKNRKGSGLDRQHGNRK